MGMGDGDGGGDVNGFGPEQLRAVRQRQGWTREKASEVLRDALGREHGLSPSSLRDWERGTRPVPADAASFLADLLESDGGGPADLPPFKAPDSAPGAGPSVPVALAGPGVYAKVCTEMFELVATGVGMVGAALGSDTLQRDGQIIYADRAQLGQAWGKLAEQNETFAKLLTQTEKQGAYLAVALATGATAGRIWQNHTIGRIDRRPKVVDAPSADGAAAEPAAA